MARKLTPEDLETLRATLRHMLAVLGGDIRHLQSDAESDSGSAAGASTEDRGSEVSNLELALELLSHDQHTQDEVYAALERIEAGAYGRCEACESWIRKSRLQMVPHARNCIDCQRAAEDGAAR